MLKKYIKDNLGAVMPVVALMLPVVVGVAGVGTDVSFWMMTPGFANSGGCGGGGGRMGSGPRRG